jgi:hypothetical protein
VIAFVADISQGNTGFADVMFLVALIVFLLAAAVAFQVKTFYATVIAVGLAALSLGWLVL